MTDNPRLQAVYALVKVLGQQKTLDQALAQDTQPLVRELVAGSLRHYFSLSERIDELLTRKLRSKDLDVRCLMLVGAYQLLHTRIPDHAAVAETVGCTKPLKKPWAKGLVNAVLRNLPPPTEEWSPAALNDHPHWFINLLRNSLPEHWSQVIEANNSRAPMTLRVNSAKISPADYGDILKSNNIEFEPGALPETINLKTPRAQTKLPGYDKGLVSVQDAAAQLAVKVAAAAPGLRVLDACAAPGGKGFHLFEQLQRDGTGLPANVHLDMHDLSPARVQTLKEQASRLDHLNAEGLRIAQNDSGALPAEEEAPYDLILLDAPCSGSGTVRRHPDIKVLRDQHDLKALNRTQNALLDALWTRLAPGGRLIYSTCSLFQEENDAIIQAFIDRNQGGSQANSQQEEGSRVQIGKIAGRIPHNDRTPFISTQHGIQTLPTLEGGDGLYYAELIASNQAH